MEIILKFTIFIIFFTLEKFSNGCENCNEEYTRRVDYFENLIDKGINESQYYKLPNNANEYKPNSSKMRDYGWVDFVIIGAGPSGSVIANRLSEIHNWKILLLEAGESPSEFSEIPGMISYLINSKFNWNYKTVKQTNTCLGMEGQRCAVTRGKILGGSSGINNLVYMRGNKEDFNRWSEQGNKGWSFDDVLPYYIKSENCQADGDANYRGKGGYWNVRSARPCSPQFSALLEAHRHLFNCSLNNDYNGKEQLGFSTLQFNRIRNKRDSTKTAFLNPAVKRSNLEVLEKAFVTKIVIDDRLKIAQGVEFTYRGKLYQVRAKKEVVLSAGAISSPKILMLSGIGPEEELNKHNIPVVNNLPVGKTLFEPPGFNAFLIQINSSTPEKTRRESVEEFLAYSGIYVGTGEGIGYYQSSYSEVDGYPDMSMKFLGSTSSSSGNFEVQQDLELTYEAFNTFWPKLDPRSTFRIYLTVMHPKSVGNLKLASNDPYQYPLIDLNMLDNPRDLDVMHQSLQIIQNLLETPSMKAMNASFVYGDYPQCSMYPTGSKDYWTCAFKLLTTSSFASTSTCRMGPNPSTAVVNDKLQVHGIQNLRVVDLSVFPDSISAGPTGTAVMLGEKASDLIKIDHNENIDTINNVIV